MTSARHILLTDNGSLEPGSTLQLRRIAAELAERVGEAVEPVSLAHSDKIPAERLEGRPAERFDAALDWALAGGVEEVLAVPLFIGPSLAIMRWVPAMLEERRARYPRARLRQAPPLYVPGERRVAEILADHVREQIGAGVRPRVAMVDHGSPAREVTDVRNAIAEQVKERLGDAVTEVAACSMERREGAEYDFNEPLLARLLTRPGWTDGPLVIALLFIAPGKHAGPAGDVAQIVRASRGEELRGVKLTRVLGEHPKLVEILADRVRTAPNVA